MSLLTTSEDILCEGIFRKADAVRGFDPTIRIACERHASWERSLPFNRNLKPSDEPGFGLNLRREWFPPFFRLAAGQPYFAVASND